VAIEYRWAEGNNERLLALAAELVRHPVSVLAAPGSVASRLRPRKRHRASRSFSKPAPIRSSPVWSPVCGNSVATSPALHELVPTAKTFALLVNPSNPKNAEATTNDLQAAARTLGCNLQVLNASTEAEFDPAFGYGGSFRQSHGQAGAYVGRILKGEKPGELPGVQVTTVELTVNLKTAKALGVNVPLTLLGRADEVIE
jgi:putative ABC transport system substrate-binding protein